MGELHVHVHEDVLNSVHAHTMTCAHLDSVELVAATCNLGHAFLVTGTPASCVDEDTQWLD